MDYDDFLPITEFDRATISDSTQMMKAMLPFLDFSMMKSISMIIRMQEFMQTMEYFSRPFHLQSNNSRFSRKRSDSMDDILNEISPYLSKSSADMMNNMKNAMQMSAMFNMFNANKDMEQSQNFQDILNMVNMMPKDMFHTAESETSNARPGKAEQPKHNNKDKNTVHNASPEQNNSQFQMLNNMMSAEQKKLFEQYLSELDDLNPENINNEKEKDDENYAEHEY